MYDLSLFLFQLFVGELFAIICTIIFPKKKQKILVFILLSGVFITGIALITKPSTSIPQPKNATPTVELPPIIIDPTLTPTSEEKTIFTPSIQINTPTSLTNKSRPTYGLSPEQVIIEYYKLIDEKKYEITWLYLTDHYKNKFNSQGYKGYIDWWETIRDAKIIKVYIRDNNFSSIVVYALVHYIYKNGYETDDQHLFTLIKNEYSDWLIDDQGG